jgi:ATP-dependent Clp protease protease subunit
MARKNNSIEDEIEQEKSPGLSLLFGEITTELVAETIAWILTENLSENPPDQLTLLINSPGGDLSAAFALIEIIQGSRIPVRTVGLGEICSAGLIIFMSGTRGHRILTPTCSVMSHHFSTGVSGNFHEILNVQKELNFMNRRIINQYVHCTGLSEDEVTSKLIPSRDVFLSPQDAVELGIADDIRGVGAPPNKLKQ